MALLTTVEGAILRLHRGEAFRLELLLVGRIADWYTCAVLIVPLYGLTQHCPIRKEGWAFAVPLHGVAIASAAALKFVLYVPLRHALDSSWGVGISDALAASYFGKLLFFFAVSGVLHALYYYRQADLQRAAQDTALHLPSKEGLTRLAVREGGLTRYLLREQIDWVEAQGNYAVIHAGGQRHLVRETMAALGEHLGSDFIRVHRSTIVNRKSIAARRVMPHGRQQLELSNGDAIPVSRSCAPVLDHHLSGSQLVTRY
jgi:hypothetical protein